MRDDTPTVYVLTGPPGPGKAGYANALVERGVTRLDATAGTMSDQTASSLVTYVQAGRDVIVEYGSPESEERDRCKRLVEEHGAQWCLINFTAEHGPLADRLEPSDPELVTDHE